MPQQHGSNFGAIHEVIPVFEYLLGELEKLATPYADVDFEAHEEAPKGSYHSWQLLSTRVQTQITDADRAEFEDALRLFGTKEKVRVYNHSKLCDMNVPVVNIVASHIGKLHTIGLLYWYDNILLAAHQHHLQAGDLLNYPGIILTCCNYRIVILKPEIVLRLR
jgi:hypothetical protein